MSLLTELEKPLIPISTNMPALRAFKILCVSPRPPRLCVYPLFPDTAGAAFSGVLEVRPKLLFESRRKPNTYLCVETP
jgi:hypothetical protein